MRKDVAKGIIIYYVCQLLQNIDKYQQKEMSRICSGIGNLMEYHRYKTNKDALNKAGRKDIANEC